MSALETATNTLASQIAAQIENFLSETPQCAVIEDGELLFDLANAQYTVTPERDKCVLQIWSEERNIVRRVVGSEIKGETLRIQVLRFGQSKPIRLEFTSTTNRQSPSALKTERARYQRLLRRLLERDFAGWKIERLTTAADLEHSFGPAHVRGALKRGQSYMAVVAIGAAEPQATIDSTLSTAVLWTEQLREQMADKGVVERAIIFAPAGRATVLRIRMAHLSREIVKWQLFEVDERSETLTEIPVGDLGNLGTHLVRCVDPRQTLDRLRASCDFVLKRIPQADAVVLSTSEVGFRLHGLQFARARTVATGNSFALCERLFFGLPPAEIELKESEPQTVVMFEEFVRRLIDARHRRNRLHPLYRTSSERWLESILQRDVSLLDDRLDPKHVYAQVPAFASSDRAMIDLLGVTREGRLAVIELKADEDRHLPLQGLDYWARVRWHHQRGEFQQNGYFAGMELSPKPPLLIMAAPALHLHPSTDTILRHLAPEIEWTVLGLDEHWRDVIRVVFRKRSPRQN